MAKLGGGDQRGAVPVGVDQVGAVAEIEGELHQVGIARDGGDGDDIVALPVLGVHVGAALGQGPDCGILRAEGRDDHRRPAAAVARVHLGAFGDQPADRRHVAVKGGAVEAVITRDLGGGGRGLGRGGRRHEEEREEEADHDCSVPEYRMAACRLRSGIPYESGTGRGMPEWSCAKEFPIFSNIRRCATGSSG